VPAAVIAERVRGTRWEVICEAARMSAAEAEEKWEATGHGGAGPAEQTISAPGVTGIAPATGPTAAATTS
jgi:hypothetical protein